MLVTVLTAGCASPTPGPALSTANPPTTSLAGPTSTAGAAGTDSTSSTASTGDTASVSTSTSSLVVDRSELTPSTAPPAIPAGYTPAPEADPIVGDCPFLTSDQVQSDTGQRMGTGTIRPADPQPVCEFVRSDGSFLATVRVLVFDDDAAAVAAVDFYAPRTASNPEARPSGWSGGSVATDTGSSYAVSKGSTAVVAETNQAQSVYSRLLVAHAIENLGL